jgi:hypothetical protein
MTAAGIPKMPAAGVTLALTSRPYEGRAWVGWISAIAHGAQLRKRAKCGCSETHLRTRTPFANWARVRLPLQARVATERACMFLVRARKQRGYHRRRTRRLGWCEAGTGPAPRGVPKTAVNLRRTAMVWGSPGPPPSQSWSARSYPQTT